MTIFKKAQSIFSGKSAWPAGLLALLGLLVYLAQALWYARTSIVTLDEAAYLYKGLLFATGQYRPFDAYGVWTNKAPLAFLIPGYIQFLFGAGVRTGRVLAIVFALLGLAAAWTTARRLGGRWLAAAAVWAFALSPVAIRTYSEGVTQSTILFLLAVILMLSVGPDRPLWQLALAGFLTGVMILVRQNMVLVLPLLLLYILWERGWRPAVYAGLTGGVLLLFFHILYWPGIMQLWTPWLPDKLASLLPGGEVGAVGLNNWSTSIDLPGRVLSFFQAVRFHFIAVVGVLAGLLLWPPRRDWATRSHFRSAVFLAALFVGLLLMHSWASITNDYCVFCFNAYLGFFNVAGVLFLAAVWPVLERQAGILRQILFALLILVFFTGMGYSAFEDLGDPLLGLNVPRVRDGRVLQGMTTLWEMLSNKFDLQRNFAERLVSTAAGALLGLALLAAVYFLIRNWRNARANYAYVLAASVLALGGVLAPLLAGSMARADCTTDVIAANEQAGAYLAKYIPQGSRVYWNGGLSVAPLLYVPGIRIYPAQINDGYAFRIGGDPQELLKLGYWNQELAEQWLGEADYVVVEGWRYGEMKDLLPPSRYDELPRSPGQTSCLEGSGLRIFQRK